MLLAEQSPRWPAGTRARSEESRPGRARCHYSPNQKFHYFSEAVLLQPVKEIVSRRFIWNPLFTNDEPQSPLRIFLFASYRKRISRGIGSLLLR